jgi:hypothetical protein
MSQAKNPIALNRLSRRSALAGLSVAAAAGVAALPAGAQGAGASEWAGAADPIFAVIAEHRAAVEAYVRALHVEGALRGPGMDAASRIVSAAFAHANTHLLEVLTVQPTTLAGVAAVLHHVGLPEFLDKAEFGEHEDEEDETILSAPILAYECEWKCAVRDFPTRLAETVRSLIGQSSSARVAQPVADPIYAAIERHRVAWADLDSRCFALADAYTPEAEAEQARLSEAVSVTEANLANVEPTTLAGSIAVLRYVAETQERDMGGLVVNENNPCLLRTLANALATIAAESGRS